MTEKIIYFSIIDVKIASIEVAGHENMTLTQRMAHARTLHKKVDVDPMTVIFTYFCVRHFQI